MKQYYLQDSRSFVGNDMLFWAKGGKGYTTDVSKAQVYSQGDAMVQHKSRSSDIPWPKKYIDGKTRPAVDMQYTKIAEALPAASMRHFYALENDMSKEVMQQALNALEVMNNGWKYIRDSHGDLYGVGWDLAQDKAEASIAALTSTLALPDAEPVMDGRNMPDDICVDILLLGKLEGPQRAAFMRFFQCLLDEIAERTERENTPQPVIAPRKGQQVSIDMSTGDDDATNRIFGELTGDQGSDGTWCAEFTSQNYAQPAIAPAPQEPAMLTDTELRFIVVSAKGTYMQVSRAIEAAVHAKQRSKP